MGHRFCAAVLGTTTGPRLPTKEAPVRLAGGRVGAFFRPCWPRCGAKDEPQKQAPDHDLLRPR